MEKSADEIREAVSAAYGARAREVAAVRAAACCGDTRAAGVRDRFYAGTETASLPESLVSYGCGNPIAIAGLQAGESVLDLGSGAGLDCVLAAQRVGPEGRVIGLDMTDEMLALAEQNKAKMAVPNVEFRHGLMEAMPVADASIDVIISNCVINLSPDKDAVFAEAFRVLRPGGRLHVSDVVVLHALSPKEREDLVLWAGCVSGALERADYVKRLSTAGFVNARVDMNDTNNSGSAAKAWRSAHITAYKPGGEISAAPRFSGERIELLAPSGLKTAASCGDDCCSTGGS